MAIRTIDSIDTWDGAAEASQVAAATEFVEAGHVLVLHNLHFAVSPEERALLAPSVSDGRSKNVSFDPRTGRLDGCALVGREREVLAAMVGRFARQACALLDGLFPRYRHSRETSLASYRPVEIEGRSTAMKQDDTRLHIDAFPSRPTAGKRILRVFSNVNPEGGPRVWHVGEPFDALVSRFLPHVPRYSPMRAWALERLGRTRGRRSEYDHVMLELHDRGKVDADYQAGCDKARVEFQPGWTWICYTDQVSHAALAGRHVLEQTVLLPVHAMASPEGSPLRVLERALGRPLVRGTSR